MKNYLIYQNVVVGVLGEELPGAYRCNDTYYPKDAAAVVLPSSDEIVAGSTASKNSSGEYVFTPPPPPPKSRAEILSELTVIDLKSIRALREGDQVRITALETQATALRAQL
jgi:hypothetical protein